MITKIVGIGGNMASGKSYLIRYLLGAKRKRITFRSVTAEIRDYEHIKLLAIGKYDKSRYPGTDFMYHPNLENDVLTLLQHINKDETLGKVGVVFEGDRLYKMGFIPQLKELFPCTFIMLQVTEQTVFDRHMKRDDNQQMKQIILKERRNKNMLEKNDFIVPMNNNTKEEFTNIINFILTELGEMNGL